MIINNNDIIYLKPISPADTQNIIRWRNKENVRKNFLDQRLFTVEGHTRWLNTMVNTGKVVQFIIYEKGTDTPVGSVFLRDIDYSNSKAEYGIFIGEDSARGKGIGTSAAELIIEYGFTELNLHKIFLRVLADNTSAVKSYLKAGFKQEAYLKDEVLIDGEYKDIILMAVINDNKKEGIK